MNNLASNCWRPGLIRYRFAIALHAKLPPSGPTDAPLLARWAKLLTMVQIFISGAEYRHAALIARAQVGCSKPTFPTVRKFREISHNRTKPHTWVASPSDEPTIETQIYERGINCVPDLVGVFRVTQFAGTPAELP